MVSAKQVINSIKPNIAKVPKGETQKGSAGYDNVRDDIEKIKNLREIKIAGILYPTADGAADEFIKTDGAGTLSFAAPAGGGDVTAAVNLTANTIVQGDDGAKGVKTSTATVAQIASNVTHSASDGTNHANVVLNDTHRALTDEHLDWKTDRGANNIHVNNITAVPEAAVTAHVAAIDHDSCLNFVANEHIDWTSDQGATNIHNGNFVALQNVSEDTTPELGGEMDCGAHTIGFTQQTATGDGTTTINWALGNKFKFTFGAQNDTFTFTAPSNPCNILLVLIQDGTGSRTATWPATVKWPASTAPTLTTAANAIDIIAFYYDGTNYYGESSLAFG